MWVNLGLLALCMAATAYLHVMFRAGLRDPDRRRWPPRQFTWARAAEIWGVAGVVILGAYLAGSLDPMPLPRPGWLRYGVGLPLVVLGNLAVNVGIFQLGLAGSSGADRGLQTAGLYAWLRHPQYTGHAAALTGWVVYTGSLWAVPTVCAAFYGFYLAMRAEEAWLAERHGNVFRDYAAGRSAV